MIGKLLERWLEAFVRWRIREPQLVRGHVFRPAWYFARRSTPGGGVVVAYDRLRCGFPRYQRQAPYEVTCGLLPHDHEWARGCVPPSVDRPASEYRKHLRIARVAS
jgi:hypothetical protein